VSYTKRKRDVLSPSSSDGVDVGSADTAGINGNVDIMLLELLERKLNSDQCGSQKNKWLLSHLLAGKGRPVLNVGNGKRVGCVWVTHLG
jgi:hypothetical protein